MVFSWEWSGERTSFLTEFSKGIITLFKKSHVKISVFVLLRLVSKTSNRGNFPINLYGNLTLPRQLYLWCSQYSKRMILNHSGFFMACWVQYVSMVAVINDRGSTGHRGKQPINTGPNRWSCIKQHTKIQTKSWVNHSWEKAVRNGISGFP